MQKWIDNGAQLAWLINPQNKKAFIYREDGSVAIVQGFTNKLSGENVLPGFELDLQMLQSQGGSIILFALVHWVFPKFIPVFSFPSQVFTLLLCCRSFVF